MPNPINDRFRAVMEEKRVMILAHRGVAGGNILDNTLESFDLAIRQGADMMEIDVCASTDGDLFVLHDGMEPILVLQEKRLTEMSTAEIRQLRYTNKNMCNIDHGVNTFDEVLEHLKGRTLINLDRCWVCWDKVIPIVERHGMADQILFKSPPDKRYIDFMAAQKRPYMYMPVIWYPEEIEYAKASGLNMVAVEIIGYREDATVMQPAFLETMHNQGVSRLVAALTLGNPIYNEAKLIARWKASGSRLVNALVDGNILIAGGHDDDTSILGNPDDGWGWLVERGFNMLMTDWTLPMDIYLKTKGYRN